jgi:hypothetical protein
MPQLDPLIWINLCYNNTLFFWVIYYIVIRIVLIKTNTVFYIRNSLKEYSFLNTNNYLFNNYYYNNYYYLFLLQNVNNNIKNNNSLNLNIIYNKDKFINFINN